MPLTLFVYCCCNTTIRSNNHLHIILLCNKTCYASYALITTTAAAAPERNKCTKKYAGEISLVNKQRVTDDFLANVVVLLQNTNKLQIVRKTCAVTNLQLSHSRRSSLAHENCAVSQRFVIISWPWKSKEILTNLVFLPFLLRPA